MNFEQTLKEKNIILPPPPKPVAVYVPVIRSGSWVFTSGQLPASEGRLQFTGRLEDSLTMEQGFQAARLCCLNALAAVRAELGSLDAIRRIVKVTGYVAGPAEFTAQPKVVNGASLLLEEIFGDRGRHARSAVGVSSLPLNAPVELELIVEVNA